VKRKSLSTAWFFIAWVCSLPLVSFPAFALTPIDASILSSFFIQHKPWWLNPIATLTSGVATARVGQTQTLTQANDFSSYHYAANGSHFSQILWGGFMGTEFPVYPQWDLAVGVGYYQPSNFSSGNGVLTQGIDARSSDQYIYSYKAKSQQLLAEVKLLWSAQERFHPYISAGLGAAFNRAYGYTTNVPPFVTFTPEFTSHSTTAFSYSLGAGVDMDIHKNWRVGVGYRFSDLGKVGLGSGDIDVIPFSPVLSQQHLYAQEVMAQLSYLIS
jgi:opacity protein-like surface antigen